MITMYHDDGNEQSATLLGSVVHFWEYHPDKKHTIVMVHGFRGTHHGLLAIVNRLTDYRVIIADLPGFGDSAPFGDRPHTAEHYARCIGALIEHLQLKKPDLLGHSFGSLIAAHLAAKHPAIIDKLILINPISTPALKGPKKIPTELAVFYYWLGKSLPERLGQSLLRSRKGTLMISYLMIKTKDRELRKLIHNEHLTHFSRFRNRQSLDEAFRASIGSTVLDLAPKIKNHTLLIAGDQDDIAPLNGQHALHQSLDKSELVVIQNVGHLVHYETPDQVAKAIKAFVK